MEPIRVLYINGGIMDRGGISTYIMNYYRHIDRTKVQIDFVVHGFEKGVFDDEIYELGGQIYNVPIKSKDYFGNIRALRKIFLTGKYKIVHSHVDAMGTIVLKEAKKHGIPIRIAHSHNTDHITNNKLKYFFNEIARKNITKYATHLWACSEMAANWLFGEEIVKTGKIKLVKNAIAVEKYKFNINMRNKLRNDFDIKNNFIIGHIGRLDYQKNHMFMLYLIKDVVRKRPNAKLVLIGDGHLKSKIEDKIKVLDIAENVILLGQRSDINEVMNIFDVFILPSLFEGLGIAAIEAQANGLICFLSNTIPSEVNVTNNIEFLSIDSIELWVEKLTSIEPYGREVSEYKFIKAGYEINRAAKELCDIYVSLVEGV